MAKDENVISLDERRRRAGRSAAREAERPEEAPEEMPPGEGAGGATAEISPREGTEAPRHDSGQSRDEAGVGGGERPEPGRMVWLYCPTCRTIEYTELELAGGRVHNVCGTQVHEAPVELDLRAEATIAQVNLERLELLQSLLDGQRQRYEEYRHRLNLAAGHPLEPYATDSRPAQSLPVADVDALGLLVSRFFQDPARRFPELAAELDREQAGGSGDEGAEPRAQPTPEDPPPRSQDD